MADELKDCLKSALDVGRLFDLYGDKVRSYAYHHLGHREDAEDVVSRVFLKIQQKQETYDPARGGEGTWIYAITRNEVRGMQRSRCRDKTEGDSSRLDSLWDEGPGPEEAVLTRERLQELTSALEALAERERDILLLRFYSCLPSKEVAKRMGLSDANVRYLQSKALEKLRRLMKG